MSQIKRVLIVGGTHGNELTGVYTTKKFERHPVLIDRPSFETFTLIGNPNAVAAGTRYIDHDLNRCFNFKELEEQLRCGYEVQRAKDIFDQFGQTGSLPIDLIIDQHSTTSNAGVMLILDQLDTFSLNLAAYLSSIQPTLNVYSSANSGRSQDSLRSLAKHRVGIEIGPIAHGTLHAELFQKNEALVYAILDYVEQYNTHGIELEKSSLPLYQYVVAVDYPRNSEGEIFAMIHPQLQFQDYKPLNPGDPLFLTFDGEVITYQGDFLAFPVFINEAAYYEKAIAMCLAEKQNIGIS